jgi:hypothetical protein
MESVNRHAAHRQYAQCYSRWQELFRNFAVAVALVLLILLPLIDLPKLPWSNGY